MLPPSVELVQLALALLSLTLARLFAAPVVTHRLPAAPLLLEAGAARAGRLRGLEHRRACESQGIVQRRCNNCLWMFNDRLDVPAFTIGSVMSKTTQN